MLSEKLFGFQNPKDCDNCENYQKKEVKEKFEDSFTIYGKKDEVVENKGIKILWYGVHDERYEICFITKTKKRIDISYDRDFWKKLSVNIVR